MTRLRIAPHSAKTLAWWSSHRSDIDFDPPYQRRGRLWSTNDKAFLIDSIINGFDIPKLYLADFQLGESDLNSSRLPYAIIDGKQRLEAVFDFFDNKFGLSKDFVFRRDETLKVSGLTLRDLRNSYPTVADEFINGSLDIVSVFTDSEEIINEIFVRLNKSKPLTGAEIRNAVLGPVPELVRTLANHDFFKDIIRFSVTRGADLNAAAKLLLFEYIGRPVSTKKKDLDVFADNEELESDKLELSIRRALDVLSDMTQVFAPKDHLLGSAGILPTYYWFVRSLPTPDIYKAREFLVRFEERRKQNREMQKNGNSSALSSSLSRFDTLNRSTNDEISQKERVTILLREFEDWKNS